MPEPAPPRDLEPRYRRRAYAYLRALLPGTDVGPALGEALGRVRRRAAAAPGTDAWADDVTRDVAAQVRKTQTTPVFSDDLFRQLADSAGPILDSSDGRPAALERILTQLPPPERDLLRRRYALGMTADQMALADGRPAAAIARDLAALHGSLVTAVREAVPDTGPEPPGGAADLGRLADQRLDGTISDDGQLVLETLLLADAVAQAHYHRHAALVADLTWHYAGPPPIPNPPETPVRPVSPREWVVTGLFVLAVLAVLAFTVLRLFGLLA